MTPTDESRIRHAISALATAVDDPVPFELLGGAPDTRIRRRSHRSWVTPTVAALTALVVLGGPLLWLRTGTSGDRSRTAEQPAFVPEGQTTIGSSVTDVDSETA